MAFLLGERKGLVDRFGGAAGLSSLLGEDRYGKAFPKGADPLDEIRMAVATERDQPALRFRGGAAPTDLYRTIMNGLDGTPMKSNIDIFWKKIVPKDFDRKDLSRREKQFLWQAVEGTEMKLSLVTGETRLRDVGVYLKKDATTGQDEEWIKIQAGDDWALVRYVMWLSCIPAPRPGD
jgi:hypothetical protein